jgi:hypothetical protein
MVVLLFMISILLVLFCFFGFSESLPELLARPREVVA